MKINIINLFRIADIFVEKPLGNKAQANSQKLQENKILSQIKAFVDKLKHSGKIFVSDVEDVMRVRTGETGYDALND